MKAMTTVQVAAFWVWYKSFNGDNRRSFARTAEAIGVSEATLRRWHNELGWDHIASAKDRELNHKLEQKAISEIVRDYNQALERQRTIVSALYRRFMEIIPALPADQIKVADLLKLMEFETTFVFGEQRGVPQGNLLGVVLGMMAPEDRVKFNGAVERARDSGRLQLAPVGPASRN